MAPELIVAEQAAALGDRDANGVSHAIKHIEAGTDNLLRTLARLERSLD